MKRILLFIAVFTFGTLTTSAQECTATYDFGDAGFGVAPDPTLGEEFEEGYTEEFYTDTIHILIPTDAGDIDETFAGVPIDSVTLITVDFIDGGNLFTTEDMGLDIICNNNGDSPDPCTFIGGSQYCALMEGNPILPGEYQLVITVEGHLSFLGQTLTQEIEFDQYFYTVNEGTGIGELTVNEPFELVSISPNPAAQQARIRFNSNHNGAAMVSVMNLLGEQVIDRQVNAVRGENIVQVDLSNLTNGIYLYGIEMDGKRLTKRVIVNK